MKRRDFLLRLGWGLGATWALSRFPWHNPVQAATGPQVRLALLADAHLRDGNPARPEAQALARAVSEIKSLKVAPDLILFAGDLAHSGDPRALALGREILSDLPASPLMVMGEGDGLPESAGPWRRLFGEPYFSRSLPGLQVLGLHTAWCAGPGGPVFQVGKAGRDRLARELARLDPGVPLLVLSHAPLARIFRPWQQWTEDAPKIYGLLDRFPTVLCLHGHVHGAVISGQWSVVSNFAYASGVNSPLFTDNRKSKTENPLYHQAIPATSWPLSNPLQGTPAPARPGLGPRGCGWSQVSLKESAFQFLPNLWQA